MPSSSSFLPGMAFLQGFPYLVIHLEHVLELFNLLGTDGDCVFLCGAHGLGAGAATETARTDLLVEESLILV